MFGNGLISAGSGLGLVAGSCEYEKECMDFINAGNSLQSWKALVP
jgi:hypothetical protein